MEGRVQTTGPFNMRVSGNTALITPRWLIAALGKFDLDPCADASQPYPMARRQLTIAQDGLVSAWKSRELVFCNPPYGDNNGERAFLAKMAEHNHGIALVLAKTGTRTWHLHVWPSATSILFLNGRVIFNQVSGQTTGGYAGVDSCLIAYGTVADARLRAAKLEGHYVKLGGSIAVHGIGARGRKE